MKTEKINIDVVKALGGVVLVAQDSPQQVEEIVNNLINEVSFQRFLTQTLQPLESGDASPTWLKQTLWLLGLIFACAPEASVNQTIDLHLPKIIHHAQKGANNYPTRSEALICLYNICANFEAKHFKKIACSEEQVQLCNQLSKAAFDLLSDHESNSPYMIQIAISFASLFFEVLE